jgi:hypothetical protein
MGQIQPDSNGDGPERAVLGPSTDRKKGRASICAEARANGQPISPDAEIIYERDDWTLFRSLRTISQQSGVPPEMLRRLVAKELADNALDSGGFCTVGELADGGFYVEDDGPGIRRKPKDIARLFSFRRPLASSKLKRQPTRGALGNGLRVVAGAIFASNGRLRVRTNGRILDLMPQESGETLVKVKPCKRSTGTRVEVWFGSSVPTDRDPLAWARRAIAAAGDKPIYENKTSPWFYDSDSFFELLKAAGSRTVREVLQGFDGFDGLGGRQAARFLDRPAASLTDKEAEALLKLARASCQPIAPDRLALLGKWLPGSHAKALGTLNLKPGRGRLCAELPYTVEAWCRPSNDGRDHVAVLVNRTPVTCDTQIQRCQERANVTIFGCNLGYQFTVGRKPVGITINVQTPHMPITSNGKEPDLEQFLADLRKAVNGAANKCQRANRAREAQSNGILPSRQRGRPNSDRDAQYAIDLERFAERLKEINSTVDFRVSSRGWCYILEEHGLGKGEFDKAQKLINECRKNGLLPIDFTVEDEARGADCLESCDDGDPGRHAATLASSLHRWKDYSPISFWDNQAVFIQMVVEKIDLKYLFLPVCNRYHVPLINSRGWSDLNLRAGLMRRFQEHDVRGQRQAVLLLCGDHDPVGLQITDLIRGLLSELEQAIGWSPDNLIIERFGLNVDFIERHGLTWIDGLQTGSGKDLGDPSHRQHNAAYVQDYIAQFDKRKVEANALVVRPAAGRQLCRDAIEKYLDMAAIADYERSLVTQRERVKEALPEAVKQFLRELG